MTYFRLILSNLLRNKPRLIFTVGSIMVAFALLGLMLPIQRLLVTRIDLADATRLMVISDASIMKPLPISHGARIAEVENVELVSHFTYFGAVYRSDDNQIAAIVTDPALFPDMVGEVVFRTPADLEQWIQEPTGIAVGRQLADRFGWKVGDLVPIHSNIHPQRSGSPVWTFRVSAIFDAAGESGDTNSMVINHRYFNEERAHGRDTVGWFAVRITDATRSAVTAEEIDALFANSPDSTESVTEKAFAQSFLRQVGDFRMMILIALGMVFWTLMLIAANTMAQATRERFGEYAILKTLGCPEWRVMGLVLVEGILLLAAGGVTGLALAGVAVLVLAAQTDQLLSLLTVSWTDWAVGAALMLAIGLLIAALPAVRAARQDVTEGLAEVIR